MEKILRVNHSSFVTKEFQNSIYIRSKLKNKMNENPSRENVLAYKKQRNICLSLWRKSLKKHLRRITEKGINNNKSFWKFVKPFLANKSFIGSNDITFAEGLTLVALIATKIPTTFRVGVAVASRAT